MLTFVGIPLLVIPSTPVKVRGCIMIVYYILIAIYVIPLRGCVYETVAGIPVLVVPSTPLR